MCASASPFESLGNFLPVRESSDSLSEPMRVASSFGGRCLFDVERAVRPPRVPGVWNSFLVSGVTKSPCY